ncbi:hypothetical protein O1L60_01735 [Streptomyces diastatochromogenes]|nr:hypothetical protein [Streptomyces diastatochromogenes]
MFTSSQTRKYAKPSSSSSRARVVSVSKRSVRTCSSPLAMCRAVVSAAKVSIARSVSVPRSSGAQNASNAAPNRRQIVTPAMRRSWSWSWSCSCSYSQTCTRSPTGGPPRRLS